MKLQYLHCVIEDYMYSLSKVFNYYEKYSSEIPYVLRYKYWGNARALQQISLLEGLAYQLYVKKEDSKSKQVQFKLKVYERDSYKPFDLQRALDLTPLVESFAPLGGHDSLKTCVSFSVWLHKCNKEVISHLFKGKGNTMIVEDNKILLDTSLQEWSGDVGSISSGTFVLQLGEEDNDGFKPLTLTELSRDVSLSWEYDWTCNFNINPYVLYRAMLFLDASKLRVSINRYENEKMKRVDSITKVEEE